MGGKSIGDNIHIEIEVLDQILSIDKKIKRGTIVEFNEEIGRFKTDQKKFLSNLQITIIEKDVLFNDLGSISSRIKIDTDITKPQQLIYEVKVNETRSILGRVWGKSIAIFKVILEAMVIETIQYVPSNDNGWLMVRIEETKSIESIPSYLKVRIDDMKNKREYFTILEGIHRGKSASVKLGENESTQFTSNIQHESVVYATYSISKKQFTLKRKKYKAVDYPNAQWNKGLYDIEIPDVPHKGGLNYNIKKATTWFRIGHMGDKYLHTGQMSLGCITITENNRWVEIYNALIKARKNDYMSVGVIEVID
jgi:hypothetical protein